MNYLIVHKTNKQYYATNPKHSQLVFRWVNDKSEADRFTFAEGTKLIDQSITLKASAELIEDINVNDLNGLEESKMKLITKIVQEANPAKFSNMCQELLQKIHPEVLLTYSNTVVTQQTPMGTALIFTAVVQYWGSEEEFTEYVNELRRNNLLIKP